MHNNRSVSQIGCRRQDPECMTEESSGAVAPKGEDMKENREARTEALPPHLQLIQLATGYWVSRIVYAAAKLDLADHLAEGPKSAAELAGATRTDGPSLHRLMRTLASLGILTEDTDHRFALTPLGEAFKTGAPGYARSSVLSLVGDVRWRSWGEFLHCLETGETGVKKAFGMTGWEYLEQHPQEMTYFQELCIGFHGHLPAAVAAAYDFSGFQTVVDIGGGTGNMLATILDHYPGTRGVLFDSPDGVREAPALIQTRGLTDRVTVEAGDFFTSVPTGDAYILSQVIHDWNDDQCLTILGHCRKAINPSGRLLIIEMVLPDGDVPHPGKVADMEMLVMSGGRERTEQEYGTLLGKAGFRLARVVPTETATSVVEAIPV